MMQPSMPEFTLTRNYLDLMVDLPWNRSTIGRRRSPGKKAPPPERLPQVPGWSSWVEPLVPLNSPPG